MASQFTFVLDSFQITDTRSLHEDTDYVTFTLTVNPQNGQGTPQTLKKSMGDVNNGVHAVNLSFPNVTVNPTDTVIMNYLIVNSGNKNPGQIETNLENAAVKLLGKAGDVIGMPELDSALEKVAKWLGDEIISIINTRCDGPVAAEQNSFRYDDLIAKTSHGTFSHSTKHPGTDSPSGCGRNSVYIVNWHLTQAGVVPVTKTVPNVFQMSVAQATAAVQAAGLVSKFTGPNQAHATVGSQSPAAGSHVAPGSTVTMTLRTGPVQ